MTDILARESLLLFLCHCERSIDLEFGALSCLHDQIEFLFNSFLLHRTESLQHYIRKPPKKSAMLAIALKN
jgi:hypothetical protein